MSDIGRSANWDNSSFPSNQKLTLFIDPDRMPSFSLNMERPSIDIDRQKLSLAKALIETAKTQDILTARQSIYRRIKTILVEVLPNTLIGMEEVSDLLGIEREIDRKRASVTVRIQKALFDDMDITKNTIRLIDAVFVPTIDGRMTAGEGERPFEVPGLQPRGRLIKQLLESLGHADFYEFCGVNSSNMMRFLSYQLIVIPNLNKMILYCDEEENRTFVVHGLKAPESIHGLNKDQLDAHPDVEALRWSSEDTWCEQLREALERDSFTKSQVTSLEAEESITANVERVTKRRIVRVDGKEVRTVYGFVANFRQGSIIIPGNNRTSATLLKSLLEYYDIRPKIVISEKEKAEVYPIETLKDLVPKVQENGEIILRGDVYSTHSIFAEELGAAKQTINRYIKKANLMPHPLLRRGNGSYYLKKDIENCLPPLFRKDGTVEIDGRIAVGLNKVANSEDYPFTARSLRKWLIDAEVEPAPIVVRVPKESGPPPTELFWKDQLDQVIPLQVGEDGVLLHNGVEYVALRKYAQHMGLAPGYFRSKVKGLNFVTQKDLGRNLYKYRELFRKSDIDPLLPDGALKQLEA
jgi:hypothetical protein